MDGQQPVVVADDNISLVQITDIQVRTWGRIGRRADEPGP